jgi:hypothetical protein
MKAIIVLALSSSFFAAPAMAHNKGDHACKKVWEACKKAGKKGKDMKGCVESIKGGGTVEGVQVDPEAAKACQEDKH